uniref:Neur_chan_LBD domain-containing protein n=1 Tax=Syphacia muris TaxID=451379 RepID=A0A0N5AYE9_9BILA
MWTLNHLTPEEDLRIEQKFRYYKEFVRPIDNRNFNFSANDYIFTMRTYIDLGSTMPKNSDLQLDLLMSIKIYDRELSFSGLEKHFILPTTFRIWLPNLTFVPDLQPNVTREIEPKSGEIMVRYNFKTLIPCASDSWRHPFEMYYCDLVVISREGRNQLSVELELRQKQLDAQTRILIIQLCNSADEKLMIDENNDKRWNYQKSKVQYMLGKQYLSSGM